MTPWTTRLVVASLIALHAIVNFATPVLMDAFANSNDSKLLGLGGIYFLFGISVGQLNLIALWAVFGPGSIVSRASWTIFLSVLMWSTFAIANRVVWPAVSHDELLSLAILIASCLAVLATWYWFARRALQLRLIAPADGEALRKPRVTVQECMTGTALLCFALALVRVAAPDKAFGSVPLEVEELPILALLLVVNFALVLPGVAWSFVYGRHRRLWIALACTFATLVTLAELSLIKGLGVSNEDVDFAIVMFFNSGQVLSIFLTLGALRWQGFRMRQGRDSSLGPPAAVADEAIARDNQADLAVPSNLPGSHDL